LKKQSVGPALREIAAKYRAKAGAAAYLGKQVKNGNVGVWGKYPSLRTLTCPKPMKQWLNGFWHRNRSGAPAGLYFPEKQWAHRSVQPKFTFADGAAKNCSF
jgi:hypothetical protein